MYARILMLCVCLLAESRAVAGGISIHRMISGDRILELAETTQLTSRPDGEVAGAWISPNGRYVAYLTRQTDRSLVCVVRSSGGRPTVLMGSQQKPSAQVAGSPSSDEWKPAVGTGFRSGIAWSPDSSQIAFPARHVVTSQESTLEESYLVVLTTAGLRRACIPLPKGFILQCLLCWEPGARRIAAVFTSSQVPLWDERTETRVLVFDLSSGSVKTVFSQTGDVVELHGWSKDGRALRYRVGDGKDVQLRESYLDGRDDRIIAEHYVPRAESPDGTLQLVYAPGISVENCFTGEVTRVFESRPGNILGWVPNSNMFVYERQEVVQDAAKRRSRTLNTLWLAVPEDHAFNHMCIALDSIPHQVPTWSQDCLRMAYVCEGRACVAELAWVVLSIQDKLDAGIPLSEEEEKAALVNNGKRIATGLAMYKADWYGRLPACATFTQDVLPYVRDKNVFFRPGTEQPIFQCFPVDPGRVQSLANTPVGVLDAGYGWQVVVYLDAHVQVVRKQ